MSHDTFASKTFSKNMGEGSDEENSEEDIDELIMNMNYFQKQNKSSEPSVICDPLMLDPTNMSETTMKLIRTIEENLKSKMIQKTEIPGNNNACKIIKVPQEAKSETGQQTEENQSTKSRRKTQFENIQEIICVEDDEQNQPIERKQEVRKQTPLENSKQIISVVNDKLSQPINKKQQVRSETSLENSKQLVSVVNDKLSQPIKRKHEDRSETWPENHEEVIYVEDDEPKKPVKKVCMRKKAQPQSKFKSFWSPGNVQISKVENKSIAENFQDPSVIETNANKLLKDIAKDIEEYKKKELPKLEKLVKPLDEYSTLMKNTSQYKNQMTKKVVEESDKQIINEKQENSNEKSKTAITKPVVQTVNNLGLKGVNRAELETLSNSKVRCSICYKKMASHASLQEHLKVAHKDKICLCVLCNRAFVCREGLRSHNKSKHKDIISKLPKSIAKSKPKSEPNRYNIKII